LGYVEESLKRYDEYRVGSGDGSWMPLVFSSELEGTSFGDVVGEGKQEGTSASIPRTVYQSWTSRDMAPNMKANFDNWRTTNGDDYKFVFFDDKEQRDWMETNCAKYWPAWNAMELPAARADLFRYCLLYVYGGVWSDIDVVPERPLRDFVPSSSVKLVVVHDGGMGSMFLYTAFIAATPGHPVLKRAMDIVMEHYQVRLRKGAVYCTGPQVLWRAVNDTLAGQVQPKSFRGIDKKHEVEYLSFDGRGIISADKGMVLVAKYNGYLDDATLHGGEPHYGREVTWST